MSGHSPKLTRELSPRPLPPSSPRGRPVNGFAGYLQVFNIRINERVSATEFFASICVHNESDFVP